MLGGYAPLPLRLQRGNLDGITAEQWVRMSADVAAASRTLPFAVLHIAHDPVAATATLLHYVGRNGVGVLASPFQLINDNAYFYVTANSQWTDELGEAHAFEFLAASVSPYGASATANKFGAYVDRPSLVVVSLAQACEVVLMLWAKEAALDPRAYGADDDKRNCETEDQEQPLAAAMLEQVQLARGSSYSLALDGTVVGAENLALARGLAWLRRCQESAAVQWDPLHADDALPYWAGIFSASTAVDAWELRKRLGASWVTALHGPGVIANLDACKAAMANALGSIFVTIRQNFPAYTDSASPWGPAAPEAWGVGVAPQAMVRDTGISSALDIRAGHWSPVFGTAEQGPWTSASCNLVVEVARPGWMSLADLSGRMTSALALLSTMVPAWVTCSWCERWGSGFRAGVDPCDEVGLT